MSWTLYRWTWQLESPLYIGKPPAGSLNRCRLYIPARVVWAAFTAELARREASDFPDYQAVGQGLRKDIRFTYLFPAEAAGNKRCAWLPGYEEGKGLIWRREDSTSADGYSDRDFRKRLVWAWPSTAVDPRSDTADEGALRETECLNTRWRHGDGSAGSQVAMVGYVFLQAPKVKDDLDEVCEITVGGDTRYGLGRLQRIGNMEEVTMVFGMNVNLKGQEPLIHSTTVLAHARNGPNVCLIGDREALMGWDTASGGGMSTVDEQRVLWCPGSRATCGSSVGWRVLLNGLWEAAP